MIRSRDGQGPLDDAPALSRRRATLLAVAGLTMLPSISFSQHDIKTWRRSSSMPPLKGTDLNGREWNLADLKGQSVLLNFWATWCGPCRMLAPLLEELSGPHPALKIVKVDVDEEADLAQQFQIRSVPTLFLYKNGSLIEAKSGLMHYPALENWVESRLN